MRGTVLTQFHLIDAVEASIPTAAATAAGGAAGHLGDPGCPGQRAGRAGVDRAARALGRVPGPDRRRQLAAAGDTGQGVTVAVMDTGIDHLPDFSGRLVGGVDLTGGGNPFQDGYGHGTFVAGLIAGDGASSNGQYSGEAPGANLVSIKVAGANGLTDLGTIIQGLQWAVDHQALYDIKVLNISLGFQSTESTVLNPLDQAVEAAWNSGIAVVTSAGNAGPFNGTILSPGDDPLVITVGALDDLGAADRLHRRTR